MLTLTYFIIMSSNIKSLRLLFVVFLFISNALCAQVNSSGTEEAYRYMIFRASPYGELMGRHPVAIKDIGHGSYFRFYRNDDGKVQRIEFWFHKQLTRGGYDRFGAIGGAAMLKFEYESDKLVRTYYDENDKPILNSWGVAVEEFGLDENGFKKSLIYKNLEGERIEDSRGVWETTWQVSNNGKTVIEKRMGKDGKSKRFNNFLDFDDVRMEFDDNGLRWETWNLDENGNVALSKQRKVAGVKTTWDVTHLDEKTIEWVDVNGKQKDLAPFDDVMVGNYGFSKEVYEHDMNGNMIGLFKFKANGELLATEYDEHVFFRSIYDQYGFLIDHRYFNDSGIPAVNGNGIARMEIIRNDRGMVTEVRRYGLNGELTNGTNDGFAIIKIEFSEEGRPIARKDYDKDGNEVKR